MSDKANLMPILVIVKNGQYNCFSLNGLTPTPRDLYIMEILKAMGGINESVEEGRWHFNVIESDNGPIATLQPAR